MGRSVWDAMRARGAGATSRRGPRAGRPCASLSAENKNIPMSSLTWLFNLSTDLYYQKFCQTCHVKVTYEVKIKQKIVMSQTRSQSQKQMLLPYLPIFVMTKAPSRRT
jgi:hypothetical protein